MEIQKYYQNELKPNGVYSINKLSKVKDGAYVINLDEFKSLGNHWITLHVNGNNITYFDSFGNEHIPKEMIKKFMGNKNIMNTINRAQACDSIICGYFLRMDFKKLRMGKVYCNKCKNCKEF